MAFCCGRRGIRACWRRRSRPGSCPARCAPRRRSVRTRSGRRSRSTTRSRSPRPSTSAASYTAGRPRRRRSTSRRPASCSERWVWRARSATPIRTRSRWSPSPRAPPRGRRVPRRVVRIRALGGAPPTVVVDGRRLALSPRHAELLVILALRPDGLSADALARALHGPGAKAVTVRAELARLRRSVGDGVAAQPYRLAAEVRADFLAVEHALRRGAPDAALALYARPLLPCSRAPAIVAARARLQAALDRALRRHGEPGAGARHHAVGRPVGARRRPRTAPWTARGS